MKDDEIIKATEAAVARFLSGYNCAESVLMAVTGAMGINGEELVNAASGFNKGLSGSGSVCGAITGAIMAMGIARDAGLKGAEGQARTMNLALMLHRRFVAQFGTESCRELTGGYDLSKPEDRRRAFSERIYDTKCIQYVAFATQLALELMTQPQLFASPAFTAGDL